MRGTQERMCSQRQEQRTRKDVAARPLTDEDGAVQVSELGQQLPPRLEDGQTPALQLHGLGVGTGRGLGQGRLPPPASSSSASAAAAAARTQHYHSPPVVARRPKALPEFLRRREARLLGHDGRAQRLEERGRAARRSREPGASTRRPFQPRASHSRRPTETSRPPFAFRKGTATPSMHWELGKAFTS